MSKQDKADWNRMDGTYIPVDEVAASTGLSRRRITQLIEAGAVRSNRDARPYAVHREDVKTLIQEQSYLQAGEACKRLRLTRKELTRLIETGVILPRNTISKLTLFDPAEIDDRMKEVEASLSIPKVAERLGLSKRQTYRLIADGELRSTETVHGRRVLLTDLTAHIAARRQREK